VRTKRIKTITFVIPCYNSAAYMDACIESILGGGRDIEIIIVNDGSTKDDTAQKADEWAEAHPDVIKVIHQENAGHGGAVMAGLRAATGVYFKVVDSDDWLDRTARDLLMAKLRGFIAGDNLVDLVVTNYVYEHVSTGSQKIIRYRGALPTNKIITWDEVGVFGPGQNIIMHAATYRTQVLRDSGLDLPKHTFYVDNIFVYVPLPYVKTLHYLPVNLYRYFIGRDDQSVNEPVQLSRLDQQMRITKVMSEAYVLPDEIGSKRLARYMEGFLALIIAASSMFSVIRADPEALQMRKQMWADLYAKDFKMAKKLGRHPLVLGSNLSSPSGRKLSVGLYRLAQRIYRFS
jgi:hypothetical protein